MAQLGLLSNYQNYTSLYKNVGAIRTTRFDKNIPSNESKEDNFQCTYFRSQFSKASPKTRNQVNDNQPPSGCSYDSIESESDNASNVLRWLRSLPPSFMIDDLEENTNYCTLREKTREFHHRGDKRSKSLGSSLKSADRVPLEEKGKMLLGTNKKMDVVDGIDSTKMRPLNKKKKWANKKGSINSSVSRLSKKYGKSDLHSNKESQQSLINGNQSHGVGILKNVSQKSMISTKQRNTIQKQITNNRRLLHSIKEIINSVSSDDSSNTIEKVKKNSQIMKRNGKRVSISSNVMVAENSTKKPFLKNPEIERTLDNAMRSTLKRYIHSNTWSDFKDDNNNTNEEPPVKRGKHVLPSLAPANWLHMDLGQNWNANPILYNLRAF